jgi:TonB family protein
MRIASFVLLASLIVTPALAGPTPLDPDEIASRARMLTGTWNVSGTPRGIGAEVVLSDLGGGRLAVSNDDGRFSGVGLFDGTRLSAVTRDRAGRWGRLRASLTKKGTLAVQWFDDFTGASQEGVWTRSRSALPAPAPAPPPPPPSPAPAAVTQGDRMPAFGEYVYVDELPEAQSMVRPEHPDAVRDVEGTVMVQALVGRDGLVKDTRVVKSIPQLDPYALRAVQRWRFKPAKLDGKSVAVWVAIPVRFSAH